ncbi:hypothetical protein [Nioella nitratireducens]|uniref:hypothetical protein n=1 Tax=Nioella nitratireducens TaxID=1287720 RepID=UPI0008FCE375|nr:hypothetical protein [Nioella nitratireducens]
MFDLWDIFTPSGIEGSRRMRLFTGGIGALIGGGIGFLAAKIAGGALLDMVSYTAAGALICGLLAALFSALVIAFLAAAVACGAVVLWQTYLGGS